MVIQSRKAKTCSTNSITIILQTRHHQHPNRSNSINSPPLSLTLLSLPFPLPTFPHLPFASICAKFKIRFKIKMNTLPPSHNNKWARNKQTQPSPKTRTIVPSKSIANPSKKSITILRPHAPQTLQSTFKNMKRNLILRSLEPSR